jgi:hypothetical protein
MKFHLAIKEIITVDFSELHFSRFDDGHLAEDGSTVLGWSASTQFQIEEESAVRIGLNENFSCVTCFY